MALQWSGPLLEQEKLSAPPAWKGVFTREDLLAHPEITPIYDRYLSQARGAIGEDGLVIKVPTSFHAKALLPWRATLEKICRAPIVSIEVERREAEQKTLPPRALNSPIQQVALSLPPRVQNQDPLEEEKKRRTLPPAMITSPLFEMPIQLCSRWAFGINSGSRNQTLWIHGRAGSGKSFLLKQLNDWVHLRFRIVSVDVISFFHEWRRAIESKETLGFIKKYRKDTDLLILENLDDLQGKTGTQQEVLFTVNALLDKGANIAVSSTMHPMQMRELLEPALFSRLFSGLTFEMPEPDRPFKEHLWRHLIEQYGLKDYSLDLMIQEKLFGIRVDTARKAYTLFINAIGRLSHKQSLSVVDMAELEGTHGTARYTPGRAQSPIELMEKVARLCGVGSSAIQGKVRRQDVTLARRFVCLALSRFLGLTNASISTYVEKDPSTVCYALQTMEVDLEKDRHIAEQWHWICSQLGLKNP